MSVVPLLEPTTSLPVGAEVCRNYVSQLAHGISTWRSVTADRLFLSSRASRRPFGKVFFIVVPALLLFNYIVDLVAGVRVDMLAVDARNLALSSGCATLLMYIPCHSVWFDAILVSLICVQYQDLATEGGRLILPSCIFFLSSSGVRSGAIVPLLLWGSVANSRDASMSTDAAWNGLSISSFTIFVAAFSEWGQASCFHQLQEELSVTRRLLAHATNGQLTLWPETGIVSAATSSLTAILGNDFIGSPLVQYVVPDDRAKIQELIMLPDAALLTTLCRCAGPREPADVEVDAKLIPYKVSDDGVHLCAQFVGEVRAPQGFSKQLGDGASNMSDCRGRGIESGSDLSSTEGNLDVHTEISFALTQTSRNRSMVAPAMASVAVQTEPTRPPPLPGRPLPRSRRRSSGQDVRLNTSAALIGGLRATPSDTAELCLAYALCRVNPRGRGCCSLHVCIAAARKELRSMEMNRCSGLPFIELQCPVCYALTREQDIDAEDMVYCDVCNDERRMLAPFEGTETGSGSMPAADA